MRYRTAWIRLRGWFLVLAAAGSPLITVATCDPERGTFDLYRDDDYGQRRGFWDLFDDHDYYYDDCGLFGCGYDEYVFFD